MNLRMIMAVTKNNPNARKGSGNKKFYNGVEVEPVKYYGKHVGDTNYISAKKSKTNEIILDATGKPIKWTSIAITKADAAETAEA